MKKFLYLLLLLPLFSFGQATIIQQRPVSPDTNATNYNSQRFEYSNIYAPLVLSAPIGTTAKTNTAHPVNGQFFFQTSDNTTRVYYNGSWLPFGGGSGSFIQNQTTNTQTGNFRISGYGYANELGIYPYDLVNYPGILDTNFVWYFKNSIKYGSTHAVNKLGVWFRATDTAELLQFRSGGGADALNGQFNDSPGFGVFDHDYVQNPLLVFYRKVDSAKQYWGWMQADSTRGANWISGAYNDKLMLDTSGNFTFLAPHGTVTVKGLAAYNAGKSLTGLDFMYKQKADSTYFPLSGGAITGATSITNNSAITSTLTITNSNSTNAPALTVNGQAEIYGQLVLHNSIYSPSYTIPLLSGNPNAYTIGRNLADSTLLIYRAGLSAIAFKDSTLWTTDAGGLLKNRFLTTSDLSAISGGVGAVNYYFNGGTASGVAGYEQMNKVANTGIQTNFTVSVNGTIASFLTDSNDPDVLQIPSGQWLFQDYFSVSSGGVAPSVTATLYKYNGSTFTSLATSSPEVLTNGSSVDLYTFSMSVPQTTLLSTDRIAIVFTVSGISGGRTVTMYTQGTTLSSVATTFAKGIAVLNGLSTTNQSFATGTSGTDFNISSSISTHTFNIPDASSTARGLITTGTQTIAGSKTLTGFTSLTNTALGTAGTDSLMVKHGSVVDAISPSYYATAASLSNYWQKSDTLTTLSTITGLVDTLNAHKATAGYGVLITSSTISVDSTKLQTIANFKPLGNTYWGQLAAANTWTKFNTFSNSASATANLAQGTYFTPSLTATANNDLLVAQDIAPTYTNAGAIATLGTITGGSGYVNGSYTNVPLTGSTTGSGATANITVSGGAVTAVTLVSGGTFYQTGQTLSASNTNLGGTGSGFSIPVSTLNFTNVVAVGLRSKVGQAYFTTSNIFGGIGLSLHASATPNTGNYFFRTDGTNSFFNAGSSGTIFMRVNNSNVLTASSSGAISTFATLSTVSGSTSGSATFNMPFQGTNYKVVLIKLISLNGTASYTFPTAFTTTPSVVATDDVAATVVTSKSTTACTITGATTSGTIELIGY